MSGTRNTDRFSSRADKYDKFRPGYPPELFDFLAHGVPVLPQTIIAEIGAGTGILTEELAKWGSTIYAIEPNAEMRHKAGTHLVGLANCYLKDGEAENTGLEDNGTDLVICAQSFHWFDFEGAKAEFQRILRPNGSVAIIWNMRSNATDFEQAYEQLLESYSIDTQAMLERKTRGDNLSSFFGNDHIEKQVYLYETYVEFDQLLGRTYSYSYMPNESEDLSQMRDDLKKIFDQYAENGRVGLSYQTLLFLGRFHL